MSRKRGTFESLVSAASAEDAIAIASEAVPKGADTTFTEAVDASADYGADSWLVTIKFKRPEAEGEY